MNAPAEIRLRSCVTLEKGKPPAAQPYYGLSAERYLSPEYLRTGGECVLVKAAPRSARVEDGDTILLWDGSNAGEVLYGRAGVLASTMSRASHAGRFDDAYFFYALKQWEPYLKGRTSGSGIPHIDKEIFGNLAITEFDLREQSKIAEVLSTVDRTIEQTEALIAKQQRIKTGVMQDLLTRGIDEHGNLRSEQTHEFKDSPLGRIPVEWEVLPCERLCREIVVGIVIRPAQYYRPDGVPVLRSANVHANSIVVDELVFMSAKDNTVLHKSQIHTGDLVTVRTGYPGTTAVVPPELDGCNCVDIVISRPRHDLIRSRYLSLWVNSDVGKRQVLEGQGGLAQQHFNVREMRQLLVKVPKPPEQEQIEKAIGTHASVLNDSMLQRSKLRRMKVGLMQDLLTGNRSVTALLEQREAAMA